MSFSKSEAPQHSRRTPEESATAYGALHDEVLSGRANKRGLHLAQADDEQTRRLEEWIKTLPNNQAVRERRDEEARRAARELQQQIEDWVRRRQERENKPDR